MMGRKKVVIEKMTDKQQRMVAFSKRRKGLFNKAEQYATLSASSVAVLVVSETGRPYVHASSPHSFEFLADQFLSTTTATAPPPAAAAAAASSSSSRALMDFNVEACDNVEPLLAFKGKLEVARERLAVRITATDSEFLHSLFSSN